MAVYFFATGPVGVWVQIPTVGVGPYHGPANLLTDKNKPVFLGHTDVSPKPTYDPKWKGVFSSQTGQELSADEIYQGTEVKVALNLQRFNYPALQALLAAPRYGRVSPPGTETYLDVGAMLQRNGLSVALYLRNEFAGTVNAAAYPSLPIGTAFICASLAAIYPENMTRDAMNVQLLFRCHWVQAAGGAGTRVCFTQDPAYFKHLPPVE